MSPVPALASLPSCPILALTPLLHLGARSCWAEPAEEAQPQGAAMGGALLAQLKGEAQASCAGAALSAPPIPPVSQCPGRGWWQVR